MDAVLERQEASAQDAVAQAEELQPAKKTRKKRSKRNDVIVTARVPVGIRDEGNAILKTLNATPTDLINAAYRYVIVKGELPDGPSPLAQLSGTRRAVPPEVAKRAKELIERTSFDIPDSYWQGKSDRDLIEEAVLEKYESLA